MVLQFEWWIVDCIFWGCAINKKLRYDSFFFNRASLIKHQLIHFLAFVTCYYFILTWGIFWQVYFLAISSFCIFSTFFSFHQLTSDFYPSCRIKYRVRYCVKSSSVRSVSLASPVYSLLNKLGIQLSSFRPLIQMPI